MHECHETNVKCKAIPGIASIKDRMYEGCCYRVITAHVLEHIGRHLGQQYFMHVELEFDHSFVLEPPRFSASVEVI